MSVRSNTRSHTKKLKIVRTLGWTLTSCSRGLVAQLQLQRSVAVRVSCVTCRSAVLGTRLHPGAVARKHFLVWRDANVFLSLISARTPSVITLCTPITDPGPPPEWSLPRPTSISTRAACLARHDAPLAVASLRCYGLNRCAELERYASMLTETGGDPAMP